MVTGEPWERHSINVTGPHPTSAKGNSYILSDRPLHQVGQNITHAEPESQYSRKTTGRQIYLCPWLSETNPDRPEAVL